MSASSATTPALCLGVDAQLGVALVSGIALGGPVGSSEVLCIETTSREHVLVKLRAPLALLKRFAEQVEYEFELVPDEIEQRAERGWTERDARARKGVGMYVGAGLGVCDSTGPARARDVAGREGARGERRSARARRRGAARRWRAPSQSRARERESGRGPR